MEKELLDSAEQDKAKAVQMAERLELTPLLARHPYDLSGGEIQRLAVGKLLLREATVLLLDEPTKGLDAYAKAELAQLLLALCREGASILVVTHDVEFAARYATGCALMFDGLLLSRGEPHGFFAGNRFYTTDANRIAARHFPMDITCEEVIASCRSSCVSSRTRAAAWVILLVLPALMVAFGYYHSHRPRSIRWVPALSGFTSY